MITNQPHTPDMNMNPNLIPNTTTNTNTSTNDNNVASMDRANEQLTLDGFTDPLDGIDPRFILSDETCRIGRKYLAEMRRILANGRALAAQHDGRAQAA
jgi:hypothetical protein